MYTVIEGTLLKSALALLLVACAQDGLYPDNNLLQFGVEISICRIEFMVAQTALYGHAGRPSEKSGPT